MLCHQGPDCRGLLIARGAAPHSASGTTVAMDFLSRNVRRRFRPGRAAAFALALAGAPGAVAAQMPGQPPAPDKTIEGLKTPAATPGPDLKPAPWVRPAIGTRLVYSSFATTVAKVAGWRVESVDDNKSPRALVGGFIADTGGAPLLFNEEAFSQLWPLKVGNQLGVEGQRFPTIWRYEMVVTTTERVTTQAGTFDCYVVDAVIARFDRGKRAPYAERILYWYAPSINAIVRTYQRRDGTMNLAERRTDLVRLERPGMAPIGPAAPAAPAAPAKGKPRPR
jgi:hypothetical protein